MPEKLVASAAVAVAAIFSAILAVWSKIHFVRRSEIYSASGKPLYQYAVDCATLQRACGDRTCAKIGELREGQNDVRRELKSMNEKIAATSESIVRIEQFMEDKLK